MPITLPVSATADDRAFKRIADRYEKWGQDAGRRIGGEMAKSMDDALAKADPKAADQFERKFIKVADATGRLRVETKKLQDLQGKGANDTRVLAQAEALERARRAEARATSEAARAYQGLHAETGRMTGGMSLLNNALAGTRFGQLAGDTQSLATAFGSVGAKTGMAITGVAAIGVAAVASIKQLYDLGKAWDDISDKITVRTGAMGADLDKITDSVGRVAENVGAPLEKIGDIAGQVAQSFKLTGPAADEMITKLSELSSMGVEVDVRNLAQAFRILGVDQKDWASSLDDLFATSQKSSIPMQDLIASVQKTGKAAKQLGLDFAPTLQVLSAFEEAGTDTEKSAGALGIALKNLAKDGQEPVQGLQKVIAEIKRLSDTGLASDEAKAAALAAKWFGKSYADILPVIESGKLDIDKLNASLGDNKDAIDKAYQGTADFEQTWERFKSNLSAAFKPAGDTVFGWLNNQLGYYVDTLQKATDLWERFKSSAEAGPGGMVPGGVPGNPWTPDAQRDIWGLPPGVKPPEKQSVLGGTAGQGIPGVSQPANPLWDWLGDTGGGSKPKKDKPNIPTSQYGLDQIPFGSFPGEGGITGPGRMIEQHTGPGYYQVDPQKVFDAQTQEISAQQHLEDARRRVLEVQANNDATEADHQQAQDSLIIAQRQYLKSQADVLDAQQGTWKSMDKASKEFAAGMDDIGAALDSDFGVSKGFPGIAENLVKFLGTLGMAPVIGALQGAQIGMGFKPGSAGSGMAGLIGSALGMATPAGTGQRIGQDTVTYATTPGQSYPATAGIPWTPKQSAPAAGANPGSIFQPMPSGASTSGSEKVLNFDGSITGQKFSWDCAPGSAEIVLNGQGVIRSEESLIADMGTTTSGTSFGGGNISGALNSAAPGAGYREVQAAGVGKGQFMADLGRSIGSGHGAMLNWNTQPGGPVPVGIKGTTATSYGSGGIGHYVAAMGADSANGGSVLIADPKDGRQYWISADNALALSRNRGYVAATGGGSPGAMDPAGTGGKGGAPFAPGPIGGTGTGRIGGPGGIPQAGPSFTPVSSTQGGRAFGQDTPASPGIGIGGGLIGMAGSAISGAAGLATSGAAMGMDGGMGGAMASAVAQIGIQEAQRAISYVGQLAGIGAGGLLETFSLNDSALADPGKSWLGKIAMGVAGARPALPNSAGAEGGKNNPNMAESGDGQPTPPPGPVDPAKQQQGGQGSEGTSGTQPGGKTINNNITLEHHASYQSEDRGMADATRHLEAATFAGMS
jgi:hypothetical protein